MCDDNPVVGYTALSPPSDIKGDSCEGVDLSMFPLERAQLAFAQKDDVSLSRCISSAVDLSELPQHPVAYFFDGDVLMRKWTPANSEHEWSSVFQVVVPKPLRQHVLNIAHDHSMSGHLGVRKTYNRLLRHFFWPSMKRDVSQYCHSCHVCQIAGKPNQVIPPAPLRPIPVMGEPFERILIDCVGPLPKTTSGFQYLLTLMCASTRYPEAIPLRSLKAPAIVKALIKFCTTFGLPKYIQSDQGSNFMSRIFSKVIKQLSIQHQVSSAYHPESQGALERFHQTLKTMLRTYCSAQGKDWDEGIPLLLFAIRDTVQESLGFSPAELVFGHSVRGPLKVLQEQFLFSDHSQAPSTNILDYVSNFRARLHTVCELAKCSLASSQSRMKSRFDQKSVQRAFKPGDQVLVLLPLPGSALQAKFSGPYAIGSKLSETDYVVKTPDRRRKSRVCHINMLKLYVSRSKAETCPTTTPASPVTTASVSLSPSDYSPEIDGLWLGNASLPCARL
uniref:Gypsy retrotransposon integrase-like protein 1 n=1 Tax=Paramormyrops kingsleyae TaxID=1676925 RepID=A0A3B3Q649_9TELE